jgi:hypothetical protein
MPHPSHVDDVLHVEREVVYERRVRYFLLVFNVLLSQVAQDAIKQQLCT